MSRPNEFKTSTTEFNNVSDALKALDTLIKDVEKRKGDVEVECESARNYRLHVGGLKNCIYVVLHGFLEKWDPLGLDLSFCQKSEQMTKEMFRCVMLFMHPVYEQIWLSDAKGRDVVEGYIPFVEIDIEYAKDARRITIGKKVLDKKVHLPELSASFASTQGDLEVIKEETLRVEAIDAVALATVEEMTAVISDYCRENRLDFDGTLSKPAQKENAPKSAGGGGSGKGSGGSETTTPSATDDFEEVPIGDLLGGDEMLEYVDDDIDEEITSLNPDDSAVMSKDHSGESKPQSSSSKGSSKNTKKGGKASKAAVKFSTPPPVNSENQS